MRSKNKKHKKVKYDGVNNRTINGRTDGQSGGRDCTVTKQATYNRSLYIKSFTHRLELVINAEVKLLGEFWSSKMFIEELWASQNMPFVSLCLNMNEIESPLTIYYVFPFM